MITFPLREAMCSGVMPFWRGGTGPIRARHLSLESSCSAPYSPIPHCTSPIMAVVPAAMLSLLLGHFSPEKDFKTCKDMIALC